jgi:hypothetical protein
MHAAAWVQLTSLAMTFRAAQSMRGRMLTSRFGFISISSDTSSTSRGWRGKQAVVLLQVLTAHVRKLRVRTFMLAVLDGCEYR